RGRPPLLPHPPPPRPDVAAAEKAGISTGENGMRLSGMGDQRLDAAIERKRGAMPRPRIPGIRAVPYAPAGRSKTYAVIRRHWPPPSSRSPRHAKRKNIVLRRALPQ